MNTAARFIRKHLTCWVLFSTSICMLVPSYANTLNDVKFKPLSGNQVEVEFIFAQQVKKRPGTFSIDKPARLVFDFPQVTSKLKKKTYSINIGAIKDLLVVQSGKHSRAVLNLQSLVSYNLALKSNSVFLTLESNSKTNMEFPAFTGLNDKFKGLQDIDFRRDHTGAAKIIFKFNDPNIPVDVNDVAGKVELKFLQSSLRKRLQSRLDVKDFGTPVKTIDTRRIKNDVIVDVNIAGDYDHLAYQSGNNLTLEVRPLTRTQKEKLVKSKKQYTGKRLSLNFQDVEIRAVLQILADFTGLNIVASDSVGGSVTLRLQNVPWDQALEIILKSKGLDKRKQGNVLMIAPTAEIAAREQQELQSSQQVEELAPLRSEFVQINYAKAANIAALLKSAENSLLSSRGNVSVDDRTNTLLVQDTSVKLQQVREIVAKLDTPVRQVEIQARIVSARDTFTKDIGIRWGGLASGTLNDQFKVVGAGNLETANAEVNPGGGIDGIADRLNVDMAVAGAAGRFALSLARLGKDTLLDLELTAAQNDDLANVIASPRLITSNQKEAVIRQGKEIPYLEASSSGATSVSFKDAVLELKVTPQITPDNRVIMDLTVKQDVSTATSVTQTNLPVIDTKEVQTQVLVDNGETIVLGGIFERNKGNTARKVPFFGDLPVFGTLFKQTSESDERQELLIFVTPRIVYEQLSQK